MACGRCVQQGTYLLFMVCSIFIALRAEATNLSPAETVCRAALKQSLQAEPVTTGSPASTPIAVLCKPLQDGTANSLALALLPAASAGTPSSDHRVWYDLYWLVLDHQQRPVVKQMFRQILRSPHDSDKGELLKVEIDATPYLLNSPTKALFGVRSYYQNSGCEACTAITDTVLLDLFYWDGQQISRALDQRTFLQHHIHKARDQTGCLGAGVKLWTEVLPTFTTGADGYPNLRVIGYQAKIAGTNAVSR